ncbi:MAG: hypothetical protein RIC35_07920 [Marinoscillum sp.]
MTNPKIHSRHYLKFGHLTFILALFITCKGQKEMGKSDLTNDWIVQTVPKNEGTSIKFDLQNNSGEILTVFDPLEKSIFKKVENNWIKLNYPYCPCSSLCPNPPSSIDVETEESFEVIWDKKSIECNNSQPIYTPVDPGKYRISIRYRSGDGIEFYHYEFEI